MLMLCDLSQIKRWRKSVLSIKWGARSDNGDRSPSSKAGDVQWWRSEKCKEASIQLRVCWEGGRGEAG